MVRRFAYDFESGISLKHQVLAWTLGLVLVATALSGLWVHRKARHQFGVARARDVELLAQSVAASLSGSVATMSPTRINHVIDSVSYDPRVAMLVVTDASNKPVFQRAIDPDSWTMFQERGHAAIYEPPERFEPLVMEDGSLLLLHKSPVFGPPAQGASENNHPGMLEGFVILGLRDNDAAQAATELRHAQLTATAVSTLLLMPIVIITARRWIHPLRQLQRATERLSHGDKPELVPVTRRDEIGQLACAFNDMARRLSLAHDQLQEHNRELEKRVTQRTAELQHAVDQLEAMAGTDPLTGLSNRRNFGKVIRQHFAEAQRLDQDLAVVMIDLDGFKPINDTLGHPVGDRMLQLAAKVLEANCREMDVAARFGGDEFIVMLPQTDSETASVVARRIADEFHAMTEAELAKIKFGGMLTMSQGLATLKQTRAAQHESLVACADQTLYKAKEAGKQCLIVYGQKNTSAPVDPAAAI